MAELQFPNIVGNFNQGFDRGQTQQFNALAGQAVADPSNTNALNQAAQINPMAAQRIQLVQQAQQQGQQQQQQAQQVDHAAKINGAANYMLQAIQTKDPAQIEGAYQTVRPYLAELGQAQGKVPPANYDPSMAAAIYQLAGQSGGIPQDKGQVLAPGSILGGVGGKVLLANPALGDYRQVPDGVDANGNQITTAGLVNRQTSGFTPLHPTGGQNPAPQSAQQATDPMTAITAQATQMAAQGVPDDQIQSWIAQQAQQAGVQMGPPNAQPTPEASQGGLGFGQSVKASGSQFQNMTPAEVAAAGLPAGTVAQKGANGKIDIVSKPDANSASITPPGDPTKTGDAYLASLPQGMQSLVKAIANGDQAPPSASSRSPEAQAILQAVYAYDPTASASNLPTRTATRKSFTSGKDAQNMTALSQLALHLDHLNGQLDTISGSALPINGIVNSVEDRINGKTTAFESTSNAVAHELRAVFANAGGGTEAELEKNLKQLDSSNSLAQKRAAVQNIAQLVQGRFGILQDKYAQGMGKNEDPFQAQFPGAESTILRLSGAAPASQAAQPAAQTQPRAVNSMGHAVVWNGSAWVPE